MKNKSLLIFMLALLSTLALQLSIRAQGTAFTYQGRLNDGETPANGNYDLTFGIWKAASGSGQMGSTITNSAMAVSNGLFTVTLDFGGVFTGEDRWLEIGARTNGVGAFTTLSPRQPVTATPYAILAGNVVSGGLASGSYGNAVNFNNGANQFTGAFTGNGNGVTNLNASQLASGTVPDARLASNVARTNQVWLLSGNAGTAGGGGNFVGTSDNQTLYFKVNGFRALMLVPSGDSAADNNTNDDFTSSVIGGCALNQLGAGVVGATIAGGGAGNFDGVSYVNFVLGDYGAVGGGIGNWASNQFTTVAGGFRNRASGQYATVGGGYSNFASAYGAFIGGGGYDGLTFSGNTANGHASTVSGGLGNTASGNYSTAMGYHSTASGQNSTAMGGYATASGFGSTAMGYQSSASGDGSFAGGIAAYADHDRSFVWCGATGADCHSQGANTFTVRAPGGFYFYTSSGASGVQLGAGGGSWSTISDRNVKDNFQPVNAQDVLARVAAMPLTTWNYKTQDKTIRHIGPMAQDFFAAFSVGEDDHHITTVDADGVALAAIQGLNEKVEVRNQRSEDRIQKLESENADLKQRLEVLEVFIHNQKPN